MLTSFYTFVGDQREEIPKVPLVYHKDLFVRVKKGHLGLVADLKAAKKKNADENEEGIGNVEEEEEIESLADTMEEDVEEEVEEEVEEGPEAPEAQNRRG